MPKPPPPRARLRDVAERAGVSIGTASNAFNRPEAISAALRDRVRSAAAELAYAGPDPTARRLRTGRAGAVGLLFTAHLTFAFEDQASTLFLQGVARGLETAETGLLIVPTGPDADRATQAVRQAAVDGFIVYSSADEDPRIAAALGRRLPIVAVDEPRDPPMPWVGIDDRAAARAAAEYVRGLGHERVAILAFAGTRTSGETAYFDVTKDRFDGYREGLGDRWDPSRLHRCFPNTCTRAREVAVEALAARPRPTAILAMSDAMAIGALQAAEDAGLAVPRQLSIVGFDGTPATLTTTPALTTVVQPQEEKGRIAAELVTAAMRTPGRRQRRVRRVLPTELVVRGSTGPPPAPRRRR
jgi:DNA-binding LacI/PurR family transcriptional regulator